MNDLPQETPTAPAESPEVDPLQIEVRELFVTLGKALRAYQLYEENNPVYQRFLGSLRSGFEHLWTSVDHLTVSVEEWRLITDGLEVYDNRSRSESLAFLMYKDGIREVTFASGIEADEVEPFLGVLHRARHVGPDGDDLLTMLWEADLQHFRYSYVDVLAEGVVTPEPGDGPDKEQLQAVLRAEAPGDDVPGDGDESEESGAAAQPDPGGPPPIDRESFNPTLYALAPRELAQIQREVEVEMRRDVRGDVIAALLDRLEESEKPERQSEVLEIFHTLLPNFLVRGALEAAADVLEELHALETRPGVLDDERREFLTSLLDRLSSPETIDELVRALEDGSIAASPQLLGSFLSHLRDAALAPLLRASEVMVVKELQPVVREAVSGIGRKNQGTLVELLADPDPVVAAGAARLVGRIKVADAGSALAALLAHPEPGVRLAAVEAAAAIGGSAVTGTLQDALDDSEREVRIAAARALGAMRFRPAARRFRDIVTSRNLRAADITEKVAFFESYGDVADEGAVPLLSKLLNGRGLLGRREPAEMRAAAALALGRIDSPEAERALLVAREESDPVIRSAVNRALRAGGDMES